MTIHRSITIRRNLGPDFEALLVIRPANYPVRGPEEGDPYEITLVSYVPTIFCEVHYFTAEGADHYVWDFSDSRSARHAPAPRRCSASWGTNP